MKFEDALKKIDGAESVGGQLIVVRDSKHILVGKSVQGTLIFETTPEALAVAAEVGVTVDVEVQHLTVDDEVKVGDEPPHAAQQPAAPDKAAKK
jgi:hypothetical protein